MIGFLRMPALEMKQVSLLSLFVYFFFLVSSLSAKPPIIKPEEIKPGMIGITHTVMQGYEIVEVKTEIRGVRWNAFGPGRHMIVGVLVDEKTKLTGAVHGMSGSPMYIDGKLAGALSRRLVRFEKDAHCGFTPIEDMWDVDRRSSAPIDRSGFFSTTGVAHTGFANRFIKLGDLARMDFSKVTLPVISGELLGIPVAVPWSEQVIQQLAPLMESFPGFKLVPGMLTGSSPVGSTAMNPPELTHGSAVGMAMATGDISMGGTGTLTYREGDRFTAFGHPGMGLGPTKIPATAAEIITTIPSYSYPHKLSNMGPVVGIIDQDRLSAIAGSIGEGPVMAPYEITRTHNGEERPTLKGNITIDPDISPMAAMMMILRVVLDQQDISNDVSLVLDGEIHFKVNSKLKNAGEDLPALKLHGVYSGGFSARVRAFYDQLIPMMLLYSQYRNEVEIAGFYLDVKTLEESRQWNLLEATVMTPEVERSGEVEVLIRLQNLMAKTRTERLKLRVPEEFDTGSYRIDVTNGSRMRGVEMFTKLSQGSRTPAAFIKGMNTAFDSRHLALQMPVNELGVSYNGQEQSGLPASVVEVLNGSTRKKGQSGNALRFIMGEQIQLDGVVTGFRSLQFKVK